MPPRGPVMHGFAPEHRQKRSDSHCWSSWQGWPRALGNTVMKLGRVLRTMTPAQSKPNSVTSNDLGTLKVCNGVAFGSSGVPSPKFQRYWLMVAVDNGLELDGEGSRTATGRQVGIGREAVHHGEVHGQGQRSNIGGLSHVWRRNVWPRVRDEKLTAAAGG